MKKFALSSTLRLPRSRAGYTLVELLVVMAIIGILMLVSYSTMQPSRALAAQQGAGMAANAFALASSEANRTQTASAVVVDAYQDGANPNNYLRRFIVLNNVTETGGVYTGIQVNRWTWLPTGVFYYPLYSMGATTPSMVMINESSLVSSSPTPTPTPAAPVLFDNLAYIYNFTSYGELSGNAQFVVASGHPNPFPALPTFEDGTRSGFVVHLEGRISPFSTVAAILEPTPTP